MKRFMLSIIVGLIVGGSLFAQLPVKPVDGTGAELSTQTRIFTATVAESGTASDVLALKGCSPVRLLMPTTAQGFTGTTVAISHSEDNTTWLDLTDSYGAAFSFTVAANKAVQLPVADLVGLQYIKLVVSAQAAARTIKVVCKPI